MADRGEPAYRTRQVWEWAARGAAGYDAMTNVPAGLREALGDSVPFSTLTVTGEQQARDGTVKTLFRTHDGHPVEAVLMRYRDGRRSICVSSQSGCPLTCTFCATGAMQFGRNLTPSEILDQALHFRRLEAIDNCVFMGMGEPFLNFDNVIAAARRLPDLGITHRRTTISTVGWLPGPDALRRRGRRADPPRALAPRREPGAALAADAGERPLPARRTSSPNATATCELRGRKVYVEYVMLEGVNDTPRHAAELAAILDPKAFKVNLIPYNPTGIGARTAARRATRSRRSSTCSTGRGSRRPCASREAATSPRRAGSWPLTDAAARV